MLNVTESVNGKFDIVLSDGYRSQLHDKRKVKIKSELVNEDADGKKCIKPKGKQQVTQRKSKLVKERANNAKPTRPSRLAAKFEGKLPANNQEQTGSNNKPKPAVQKSNNGVNGSANGNETAFVTKTDLAKLLESLNQNNTENESAIENEANLGSTAPSEKYFQPTSETNNKYDVETEKVNMVENEQLSEKLVIRQESTSSVVKQSNLEDIASITTKESIKPLAMRSSFAIGAPGLVIDNPHDDKAAKHRQWVKELEQQIQEKKEKEKQLRRNQSVDISPLIENERAGNVANRQKNESNPLKIAVGETTQQHQDPDRSSTGHGRGRGLMSMMLSENEVDKQRKKLLDHQKAIELQVEDRRRQKMAERERRLREEAIEDDRVAKEREKLHKQFEEELNKTKEKEAQAKRRARVLQEGISKAAESAQQLKRDKRKNRLQGSTTEVSVKVSSDDAGNIAKTHGQQSLVPVHSFSRQCEEDKHMVPPLNLSRSFSPVNKLDKSNDKFSSRLSDSTLNVKRNSLSVRDIRTSYSEPDKETSETLINKWVNEDFSSGSLTTNCRELNYDRHSEARPSGEFIVPFHRTASATLFRETSTSQEVHENSRDVNELLQATGHFTERERKVVKKGRSVPEVQPTRTSRLREKVTDSKNSSLTSRRKKHGADTSQQTVQKQKSKLQLTSQETSDERLTNMQYKNISSVVEENGATNIPSHLLATFTPTAHQEKILEQLASLRKGLLMKDQEIKTRVFHINEYEIQA